MIRDSVARHLERHRLRRRHAAAVARGPVPAADLQAEARRRRDGVARSLDVLGHSCAVEGAQVCFARDYDAKQERWWHRALLRARRFFGHSFDLQQWFTPLNEVHASK